MLQDLIKIKPQSQKTYHSEWYEFATPVSHPKTKARQYFQWALIFHAREKPAEAYKYYEKAIIHHKRPLYLRQMALLHHEMGYFKDAIAYMRSALDIERAEYMTRQRQAAERQKPSKTLPVPSFEKTTGYSRNPGIQYQNHATSLLFGYAEYTNMSVTLHPSFENDPAG
jgi:tetratricopeptide (TPR) repeat protein